MGTVDSKAPKPISQMGSWDFWASPFGIGLRPEDAEAIASGEAEPDQVDRMKQMGNAAKLALISAPANQTIIAGHADFFPSEPELRNPS